MSRRGATTGVVKLELRGAAERGGPATNPGPVRRALAAARASWAPLHPEPGREADAAAYWLFLGEVAGTFADALRKRDPHPAALALAEMAAELENRE